MKFNKAKFFARQEMATINPREVQIFGTPGVIFTFMSFDSNFANAL